MPISLLPHNAKTYERAVEMFKTEQRVGVVQPTGTGKTFIFLKWVEDNPKDRVLILSPSTAIFRQIKKYIKAEGSDGIEANMEMVTYQALLRQDDDSLQQLRYDKIVLDEFHRIGAEQWEPQVRIILACNPHAKVFGFSATPIRYLNKSRDMALELFGRKLATEMTLGNAVRRGILPAPKYIPVWYDYYGRILQYKEDIKKLNNGEERKKLAKLLEEMQNKLELAYGVDHIFAQHLSRDEAKFILFCKNVKHTHEMVEVAPEWFKSVTANVHCYVSLTGFPNMDSQLREFEDDKTEHTVKLLFTVDRVNEGLHVEDIDGVILLRPTVSPNVYLQQIGRALSTHSKEPLVFDLVNNFQNVKTQAMKDLDCNVFEAEYMEEDDESKEETVDSFSIFADVEEFTEILDTFESALYLSEDKAWLQKLEAVVEFKKKNNRFPKESDPPLDGNFNAGAWCRDQKAAANRGTLTPARFAALKTLGLLDETLDAHWNKMYALTAEFRDQFGRFPTESDPPFKGVLLGGWRRDQLVKFNKKKLTPDKIRKLNALGIFDETKDAKWQQNFSVLVDYIDTFGCVPTKRNRHKGKAIGAWYGKQKQLIKSDSYPTDRREKLLGIPVVAENISQGATNTSFAADSLEEKE